jgi:carbamoyltransferase
MKVLGISPCHDSSVCIIDNGKIDFFCKEERLTGKKRDDFPLKSLLAALKHADNKIDFVVMCSPYPDNSINFLLEPILNKLSPNTNYVKFCSFHHLAHASLAFYNSGFKKSLIFVIDRNGSRFDLFRESESIFIAEYPDKFIPIYKSYYLYNIGKNDFLISKEIENLKNKYPLCEINIKSTMNITKVYETATTLIDQNPLENGKTMGLSAYGKNKKFKKLFINDIPDSSLFYHLNDTNDRPILKEHINKITKDLNKNNYTYYADYAYQVQKQTQENVLNILKKKIKETNIKNVCLSGGYALNVVTNAFLTKNLPNINFYFEPIADDTGNSIGSAMFVYRKETKDKKINKIKDIFFNNKIHNINIKGKKCSIKEIAKKLTEQKIVAVFNKKSEAGPRSLGNRSILFDPSNKDAKEIINGIKNREWYRPFAGSILKEYAKKYFHMMNLKESPHMTLSFKVKLNKIPGITHVDNTCRIQTVDKTIPHFYELLKEFLKLKNLPILLNTSFNISGKPLVETVEDAVNTFNNSKIDVLWFPEKEIILEK